MASDAKLGDREKFELNLGREIGRSMKIGDKISTPRTQAKVVLIKTEKGPRILTAYPIE